MKPSLLIAAFAGYVLGARAGRRRYEQIAAAARRIAGNPTVQSTAGAAGHQLQGAVSQLRHRVGTHSAAAGSNGNGAMNGHHN